MQCEKFEGRMHELLDRRLPPESDAQLREHALVCQECAEQLAVQESLFAGLKLGKPPELSADFTHRVLAMKHSRSHIGPANKFVIGLLVLAAVLLVALIPAAWLLQNGGRNGPDEPGGPGGNLPIAGRSQSDDTRKLSPEIDRDSETHDAVVTPVPQETTPEGGSEVVNSPPESSDREDSQYVAIPSFEELAAVDPVEQAERIRSAFVARFATPLKPVTNSVNGAINVVRRTLAAGPDWPFGPESDDKPQADTSPTRQTQDLV